MKNAKHIVRHLVRQWRDATDLTPLVNQKGAGSTPKKYMQFSYWEKAHFFCQFC